MILVYVGKKCHSYLIGQFRLHVAGLSRLHQILLPLLLTTLVATYNIMGSIEQASPQKMTKAEATAFVDGIAEGFRTPMERSPIQGTPADVGLEYEDIFLQAIDGVPLEGWLMLCHGSDKIVIVGHPRWFNRSGCPTHREPWKSLGGYADERNKLEVNFIPDFKILHDAGYNVLAYDSRNMGLSGAAHGGLGFGGRYESRDVLGTLRYVRSHAQLKHMSIGLFSRCNSANATMFAMTKQPEEFKVVKCLVAAQPLSVRAILTRTLELRGISDYTDYLDKQMRLATNLGLDDMSPVPWARSVAIPTFIYQVRRDNMTYEHDVQEIFDNVVAKEKELHWVEDTTSRWDGYREFQNRPQPMLDWFAKYM